MFGTGRTDSESSCNDLPWSSGGRVMPSITSSGAGKWYQVAGLLASAASSRQSGFCSGCPAVQSENSFVCGRPERLHVGTEQKAECWPPCASHEGSAHNLLI